MVRHGIVLLALALAPQWSLANDLLEFYHLALQSDPTLQSASAQRAAAVEARPEALSQLLPQLTASGSAQRERSGLEAALASQEQLNDCGHSSGSQQERCYGNTHGYDLTLSQTVWSYEAFEQLKEASRQVAGAEATFRSAEQDLMLRVAKAYFAILAATDQLGTARSQREAFRVLLDQAKGREQTGVGPRSDVEQAQSFYDATEQGVIDTENALDDARLALTQIIGVALPEVAPLRDPIPLTAPEPDSVEDWVRTARRENPALLAAELKVEAADYDISVQRGKGFPVVSLGSSSSKTFQGEIIGGNQTLDVVGLFVSWPLFQGGAVSSAIRKSRALSHQAQADYEADLRSTESLTRSAFRSVVTGVQRIAAAGRAVGSAKAAVEASKRNVEFGTGTEFDLLNAQNLYSNAVRSYSQTRYDYLTQLLTLKQLSGRLSERDLADIDALLVEHTL